MAPWKLAKYRGFQVPEDQDPIAREVVRRLEMHETAARSQLNEFIRFQKYWANIPDPKRRRGSTHAKGRSDRFANVFVPEFHRDVETVTAGLMGFLFGEDPFFELMPYEITPENILNTYKTQAYLEQVLEEMEFEVMIEPIVRSIVRDGTGVGETGWGFRTHWQVDADGEGAEEITDYEGPVIEQSPMIDFHFYPFGFQLQKLPWLIKRERPHEKNLAALIRATERVSEMANKDGKIADPKVALDAGGDAQPEGVTDRGEIRQIQGWEGHTDEGDRTETLEYWGEHPLKPDSPLMWKIVVVNRSKTVVEVVSPFDHGEYPQFDGVMVPQERNLYGFGAGHATWRKQKEINDFKSLARDILMFQLYNPWQREGGTNEQTDEFNLHPMKIFQVEEHGRLSPLRPPIEVLSFVERMEDRDKNDMRHVTGALDVIQGEATGETATEFRGLQAVSAKRLNLMARQIAKRMIKPMLYKIIMMSKQFGKARLVKVFGKPVMVQTKDLVPNAFVRLKVSAEIDNKTQMARRTTSFLETLVTVNAQSEKKYNLDPFIAKMAKLLGEDPRTVIPGLATSAPSAMRGGGGQDDILALLAQAEAGLQGSQPGGGR